MERFYQRVDDLDEKIKDMNLLYLEWKLLFLITEIISFKELKQLIDKSDDEINTALGTLVSKGLIKEVKESVPLGKEEKEEREEQKEIEEEAIPQTELKDEVEVELKEEVEPEMPSDVSVEDITEDLGESEDKEIVSADIELEEKSDIDIVEEPEIELVEEKETNEHEEASMSELIEEIGELEKEVAEEVQEDELTIDISSESKEAEPSIDVKVEGQKKEPVEEKKPKAASGKKVMVVDDSIVIRKMVEIALEEDDYNIITAISGKEGMQLLDKENPNLVILDMMLPDMNGIDLLKAIKASKGIPVIMLSGKDSPQLIETAKSVGADDFLPKPFRDEELIEKVKTLLK